MSARAVGLAEEAKRDLVRASGLLQVEIKLTRDGLPSHEKLAQIAELLTGALCTVDSIPLELRGRS